MADVPGSGDDGGEFLLSVGGIEADWVTQTLTAALGTSGAWLLRSIVGYHWRARCDIASRLLSSLAAPGEASPRELWAIADLQFKSWHVEAAELFSRLLDGVLAFAEGDDFFDRCVRVTELGQLLKDLQDVGAERVAQALGYTGDAAAPSEAESVSGEELLRDAVAFTEDVAKAASEVCKLVRWRSTETGSGPILLRATRDLTNSYRHGTLVLYPSCAVPGWETELLAGETPPESTAGVLVYLGNAKRPNADGGKKPKSDPQVRQWGWVVQGTEETSHELDNLAGLGLLTARLARAFMYRVLRPEDPLLWAYAESQGDVPSY